MTHRIRSALLALPLVLLSACATMGHDIDLSKVDQLQPGVSTVQDAIELLGKYSAESIGPDGVHAYVWSYSHANGMTGHVEARSVALAFDRNGKLVTRTSSGQTGQF